MLVNAYVLCACFYVLLGEFCHVFGHVHRMKKANGHVEVPIHPPVYCYPSCLLGKLTCRKV